MLLEIILRYIIFLILDSKMHHLFLVIGALFSFGFQNCIGSSQFLDLDIISDPSLELFPQDDLIDFELYDPSGLDDLLYDDFLTGITASDCISIDSHFPTTKVRARKNACPAPQGAEIQPGSNNDKEEIMNSSPAPLDLENWTGENFVDISCPENSMDNRAIPVCSSHLSGDVYPDAFGGMTLRNCDLSG
jgi:hypothetical protein